MPYQLNDAAPVADVGEDEALSQAPALGDPAVDDYGLADVLFSELAAVMSSFK